MNIPKIIYCFWDSELTPFLKECLNTWKLHNPNYKIIVINNKTINNYINIDDYSFIDSPARLSDILRLKILSEKGGIWCDISTYMTESLDTILNDNDNNYEIIGYSFPKSECKNILESWFIACKKNSEIMQEWTNEFLNIKNVNEYVKNKYKYDINCKSYLNNYLAIHISYSYIIYKYPNFKNKVKLYNSLEGPYKIHNDVNFNPLLIALKFYFLKKCNKLPGPFIKCRKYDRFFYNYIYLFFIIAIVILIYLLKVINDTP